MVSRSHAHLSKRSEVFQLLLSLLQFCVFCCVVSVIITSRYLHVCLTSVSINAIFLAARPVIPKTSNCDDGDRKHSSGLPHNTGRPDYPNNRHAPPPLILPSPFPREGRRARIIHHGPFYYRSSSCSDRAIPRVPENKSQAATNSNTCIATRTPCPSLCSKLHVQRTNSSR
jgi:hypothetical protein